MAEQTPTRIGSYEILKRLAVGGMGQIYLARQVGIAGFERLVVVKTMLQSSDVDTQSVDMFFDEARLAATLNHPNIVSVFELGRHADLYFIAMEYIAGIDLFSLMKMLRQAKLHVPPRIGAAIFRSAALALDYAHNATDMRGTPLNIVHRDVSPQNIMVRLDGGVKVVDFGIAQAANRFSQTVGDVIKGKLLYMSPEQVRGQPLTAASDQFSLGVVAWELFALKNLFLGESPAQIMFNVATGELPTLAATRRKFAPEMSAIVQRMLDRDPARRYASCAEAARAMQSYLDATGGSADREVAALVRKVAGKVITERGELESLAAASSTVTCAGCGNVAPRSTRFCSRCGVPLVQAAAAAPPEPELGSDRLPSLNLVEISGAVARSSALGGTQPPPLEGPATLVDVGVSMTVGGAIMIRDGGHNVIDFGDAVESGVLELSDDNANDRYGPREPVFVGRRAELEFLQRQLESALAARTRNVLLIGEDGIGKSRLLREFAQLGQQRDCITAYAVGLRRGVPLALDLFRQWVFAIARALASKKAPTSEAGVVVGARLAGIDDAIAPAPLRKRLAQLFDAEPNEVVSAPLVHGQRQLAALLYFFERVAAHRPLLLLADELHGADQTSIDLLQKLTGRLPDARLCVVSTTTPGRGEQLRRGFEVRELPPLELTHLRSLAQSVLAYRDMPADFDEPFRAGQGNPTIAVQQVRNFTLSVASGPAPAPAAGRGQPETSKPRSVTECVEAILQQLGAESGEVIAAAALLGEIFSTDLLERLFTGGAERVRVATLDAMQLGMLQPHDSAQHQLRFAQSSFRRSVLAALDEPRSKQLRFAISLLLAQPGMLPAREAGEVLALYTMSAEVVGVEAIQQLATAAAVLLRQGVVGPAIEMLGRAVDCGVKMLASEGSVDDRLATLLLRLGSQLAACLQQIDPGRGSTLLLHLLDQVPPLKAGAERPAVFWRLAQCLRLDDRQQPAAAAVEHGLRCPVLEQQPELRAMLDAEKAMLLAASGGHQGAVFLLTDALDTLGRTPVPPDGDVALRYDQLGDLYCHLARAHFGTGHPERAQRAIDRARKVARFGQQLHSEVRALLCAAETTDDAELAAVCLTKAVATADELCDPLAQAETNLACGLAHRQRDPVVAKAMLSRVVHAATLSGRRDLAEAARAAAESGPS